MGCPDSTIAPAHNNRYWDDRATPREESYREDVATAKEAKRPDTEVCRELRATAESGWDFSARWLADGRTLSTIHTTDFVPPDLNSLLYQLERTNGVLRKLLVMYPHRN